MIKVLYKNDYSIHLSLLFGFVIYCYISIGYKQEFLYLLGNIILLRLFILMVQVIIHLIVNGGKYRGFWLFLHVILGPLISVIFYYSNFDDKR